MSPHPGSARRSARRSAHRSARLRILTPAVLSCLLAVASSFADTLVVRSGDLGPGLMRASFGHYYQTGGKFGSEDQDRLTFAPGSASWQQICTPGCAFLPYLGQQVPEGCTKPERFAFRYYRQDLFQGVQKLWLALNDIRADSCGPCQGSEADIVECRMRSIPYADEEGQDRDADGNPIPGTGYRTASYHEALRGLLAEGLAPYVSLRCPFKRERFDSCPDIDLTCNDQGCLAALQATVRGFYEYVRRNSAGAECEPACDFPKDALDSILWSLTFEPDLGRGMGFFGPSGYADYGEQLDAMLAVPYPSGHRRRVAAPDITSKMAEGDINGHRADWLSVVRNKVDYVTYHGLYCGEPGNAAANLDLPAILRTELGTNQPFLCTEFGNNDNLSRQAPCGGNGCGGGAKPDCAHNRLQDGLLSEAKAILYMSNSNAGLEGVMPLGIMEGQGVACGGYTGLGLVGNSTRDIDPVHPGKELFLQGPGISFYSYRMLQRDIASLGGGHILPVSAPTPLVAAARTEPDGSISMVVLNDSAQARTIDIDLSAMAPPFPTRRLVRVVAPANVDSTGKPAPLLDVVTADDVVSTATFPVTLHPLSLTSIRIGSDNLPAIQSISPASIADCGGAELLLTGEGLGNGDVVRVGETETVLRDCAVSTCRFTAPVYPLSSARQSVDVRVESRQSGAVSNALGFSYVAGPILARIDSASSEQLAGGAVTIEGSRFPQGAAVGAAVFLYRPGKCPGCGKTATPEAIVTPLCLEGNRFRFLVPATWMFSGADVQLVSGAVASNCLEVPLDRGAASAVRFCIDTPHITCQKPAVGTRDSFAGPGTTFTFRVTNPGPAGTIYVFEPGDGLHLETGESAVAHRYGTAVPLGGKTVTIAMTLPGKPCPLAVSMTDAVYLGSKGLPDILTAPGAGSGNPARIRGFKLGKTRVTPVSLDFFAYGTGGYGALPAACDLGELDGAGVPEESILTGPGPGPVLGPQVRAFRPEDGGTAISRINFFAYGTLRYGVHPAASNLDHSGLDEVLTGAGPGSVFGPHVRAFLAGPGQAAPLPGGSFYAFRTLKYGVDVAELPEESLLAGAGPGPSFAPTVRSFQMNGTAVLPGSIHLDAYASRYGVRVASGIVRGEQGLLASPGPGPANTALLRLFLPPYQAIQGTVPAFPTHYGAIPSGAVLADRLVASQGPDPTAGEQFHLYDADLSPVGMIEPEPYPRLGFTAGCEVAAGLD